MHLQNFGTSLRYELKTKKLRLDSKIFQFDFRKKNYEKGFIVRRHSESKILKSRRDIDIYLPPGYNRNLGKRYPVLYMHDGNNLFYPQRAFAGIPWHVDTTIERLVNCNLIEEVIVVGVYNTPHRSYEYTWTPMKFKQGLEGGGGYQYARYLIEEIKPYIDHNFRTLPDRNNTAIMGSSLGGLSSFYFGIHCAKVFSKIGIISPSFWWGQGIAFKDVENMSRDLQIWMDMGTKEGYYRNVEQNMQIMSVRWMKQKLNALGYFEGYNLGYLEDKGARHDERSWGERLHLPLIFFYGKNKKILFSKR